jgi:putative FmdB family regulatory protein
MPIYEYRCSDCGFQDEFLQKISEPTMTVCPKCGKSTFTKLLSAAGFQLKGSGWYATDFRGGGKPATGEARKGGGSETSSEAKSETKAEAKPESKSEAKPASTAATGGGTD